MLERNPDSKSALDQQAVPGWRPATVARLLRGKPPTSAEALDEMDRHELDRAAQELARRRKLPWSAVRIIEALFHYADRRTGKCNPSCATIAARAGCGSRTVERILPVMRVLGLLDWDNHRQHGYGRGKPPKKTSNSYTFARIDLGKASEFVTAKLLSPVLENLARARTAAAERTAAIRAIKNTPGAASALSVERRERGAADLRALLAEIRDEAPRLSEYVPTPGTGSRLMAALERGRK